MKAAEQVRSLELARPRLLGAVVRQQQPPGRLNSHAALQGALRSAHA
jgi:hypothetical protein